MKQPTVKYSYFFKVPKKKKHLKNCVYLIKIKLSKTITASHDKHSDFAKLMFFIIDYVTQFQVNFHWKPNWWHPVSGGFENWVKKERKKERTKKGYWEMLEATVLCVGIGWLFWWCYQITASTYYILMPLSLHSLPITLFMFIYLLTSHFPCSTDGPLLLLF